MLHVHREWSSAEEFLEYIAELFPFHPAWPDPGLVSVTSAMPDGDTPLHIASAWGDVRAVELLLSAGAAVDCLGDMGETSLGAAASNGHEEVAALLLRNGADPHLKSEFGMSPYQTAMREGRPELQRVFVPYAGA